MIASHVSSLIAFYVLLKDRLRGILPHLQAGEAAEGIGVFQMKGQFLIGELAVLLEHCRAKNLLGSPSPVSRYQCGKEKSCPERQGP